MTIESSAKPASGTGAIPSSTARVLPSLHSVLAQFAPLPRSALFLGLANDGLPVLLNLSDPLPGPVMIAGDEGSGKTNFLRTISCALDQVRSAGAVSYSVISSQLSEWRESEIGRNRENLFSPREASTAEYLHSLVVWAHTHKSAQRVFLLLIDHFETLLEDAQGGQDLRWLLLRGPSRCLWPIVAINSSIAVSKAFGPWLDFFRTRLFGSIRDQRQAQTLTGFSNVSFTNSVPGFQFAMREGNDWLPFWIPTLD
ncbi:MAG TPA: NACHT domain-containing protein [Anaerolineales bacterium]|nr:NACHT domain-containing protein [Anaerolineales bacterium]